MTSAVLTETIAKYKAVCPVCFKQINPGEPIRVWRKMKGKTRWAHADCYNAPPDAVEGEPVATAELPEDVKQLIDSLTSRVEALETNPPQAAAPVATIEIKRPNGRTIKIEGTVHPVFPEVLELANARKHIFLPGPAGCGKSHLAHQVAEAIGLKFRFISCSAGMSESQLLGRLIPVGEGGKFEYVGTDFLDCYENGGVFLFDEIDAADANVLLVVNSALANGHLSVPSRLGNTQAKRHPDFVCIAAANTFGRGADRQYVGRSELDESTLDRFRIGTVPMDYDEGLEAQLCGANPRPRPRPEPQSNEGCTGEGLLSRLLAYRERMRANRLERILSTRFIKDACEMVTVWGWSYEKVDSKLFAGWRRDEVAKVKQ